MFELVMTVAGERQTFKFDNGADMEELYERMTTKTNNSVNKKRRKKSSNKKATNKSP